MTRSLWPALLLALLAGALGTLSQGIWPAWWLQVLSLAGLLLLLFARPAARPRVREAFLITFSYGLSYFGIGVGWLFISMHRYGGLPAPLAGLAVLLMAALLASFSALAAALATRLTGPAGHLRYGRAPAAAIMALAGAWGLAEWLRSWVFTGFPWIALGYSQLDGPLAHAAPALGVHGVGLATCLLSGGLALVLLQGWRRRLSGAGLLMMALALISAAPFAWLDFATPTGKRFTVRLVQGNIAQDMKFDPARSLESMRAYIAAIATSRASLTVLPETAWTSFLERTPPQVLGELAVALGRSGTRVALGLPALREGQITNSVALIDERQQVAGRYDKHHLVPFGEFIPPGFRWFVDMMQIPLGDFARGPLDQELIRHEGQLIGFNICYEDLFGEQLAGQVRRGAQVLINVSNIAWFGDSHALPQHLAIARMRALETARPMLRATNTGVTGLVLADGRLAERLPALQAGHLDLEVGGMQGLTPYARFGNLPFLACALLLLVAGWTLARSRR